ncbi:MAG: glycosyltransferase family 4 protein [Bacteroidetes bacterium]|jgi:glycosyltransferase involved in cell wall biosynthesis|nr:glycosyltransferase family 4 protein [Bacteroidota bacterium]
MKRITFLYSELAGYLFACFEMAAKDASLTVVHWPVNEEAPFSIPQIENVTFHSKDRLDIDEMESIVGESVPQLLLVSGWLDKDYLRLARSYAKKIPTVILFDTQWTGSFKQRVMSIGGSGFIKSRFSHAWVAGEAQKKYAMKIGFDASKVMTGFYSADVQHFNDIYKERSAHISGDFPRRLLYVGRYVEQKNIDMLCSAFIEANEATGRQWSLRCIGTGELFDQRIENECIEHVGFVQPKDLLQYLLDSGVFVLPSLFEPWGVAVHEMACAGFPLLLSDKIGAGELFLKEGHNGWKFSASSKKDFVDGLKRLMSMEDIELLEFSKESHRQGQQLSPSQWAGRLLGIS